MSSHSNGKTNYINLLQEFSLPLLAGVVVALLVANVDNDLYHRLVHDTSSFFVPHEEGEGHHDDHSHDGDAHDGDSHDGDSHDGDAHDGDAHDGQASSSKPGDQHSPVVYEDDDHGDGHGGHKKDWRHYASLHFIINDIFMVIFFGIAAKEITEACLPGGALNPPQKAVNPLLGTLGGVFGPVGTYFLLNAIMGEPEWSKGWGIPTATDIALAWLVARLVFGKGHPAISFLLLLAVADDGIGLGIIAFAYPDPTMPTEWLRALWILPAMGIAFGLRATGVKSWVPYVLFAGVMSWYGLYSAHLHPALALVPIVPFMPGPKRDAGLFQEEKDGESHTLDRFEHDLKLIVDFGLFFFAFANAGVPFNDVNNLTWIVLLSLLIGKTVGITAFSWVGSLIGFPLPTGMQLKHLFVAGIVAGLGLTVALFVSGQAFKTEMSLQGAAKMGALFSAGAALLAIIAGKVLNTKSLDGAAAPDGKPE